MKKQLKTITLSGKKYAQVSERLRAIHEDHKDFDIITSSELVGEYATLKATLVIREETNTTYTGHSYGKVGVAKAFEKLETIAVGRALAFAGYHADGEIASSDEMADYTQAVDSQELQEAISLLNKAETIEDLRKIHKEMPLDLQRAKQVIEAGKKRAKELDPE